MLPFSFTVPFSLNVKPKNIFKSATTSSSRQNSTAGKSGILPISHIQQPHSGIASKDMKLSWKSRLRRPHPFLSREPGTFTTPKIQSQKVVDNDKKTSKKTFKLPSMKHVLLLSLFILSFLMLILGLVYGEQVTSTHPPSADSLPVLPIAANATAPGEPSSETAKGHLLVRQPPVELDVRNNDPDAVSTSNLGPFNPTSVPVQAPSANNASSVVMDQFTGEPGMLAHTPSALAALFFYIATMPILSITHASIELAILVCLAAASRQPTRRSSVSSIDDDDFDSDAETIIGEDEKWKHIGPVFDDWEQTKVEKFRQRVPMLSAVASLIIMAGWIAISAIQTHCEITPNGSVARVCPTEPYHGPHAISKVSIARAFFSWLTVVIYVALVGLTLKSSDFFGLFNRSNIELSPVNRVVSPPFTGKPILKTRSRSTSLRRKHVRFSLENESQYQQAQGDDGVHYIPAPSDAEERTTEEPRTPWQWQGSNVDDFKQDTTDKEKSVTIVPGSYGRNASASSEATALSSNPTRSGKKQRLPISIYNTRVIAAAAATRTVTPTNIESRPVPKSSSPPTQSRGGSFDLGLASMVKPASNLTAMIMEQNTFNKRRSRSDSGLGSRPKFGRQDTSISAMSDGRRSVDLHTISRIEEEGRDVSPL